MRLVRKLIVLESPYAGDVSANVEYARRAVKDSLDRGEAPFASHLLYTQVLDDSRQEERDAGMLAGLAWAAQAERCVVYADRGISDGMKTGIEWASSRGIAVEFRNIGE